jgi:hypothetical protein
MTKEQIEAILRTVRLGLHPDRAAAAHGVSSSTLGSHKKRHPEFARLIKEAEATAEQGYLGRILRHTEKQWTACAWILERRWPERWAKREVVAPQNKDDARRLAADVRAIIAQESDATPTSTPQAPQGGEATS